MIRALVTCFATFAALACATASLGRAQCADWSQQFHVSGPDSVSGLAAFPSGLEVFDDGTGPALYMSGSFDLIDGQPTSRIARWNGVSWAPLASPFNFVILALKTFDDGAGPALYAGGTYIQSGAYHYAVIRWNGSTWTNVGGAFNNQVTAFGVFDDGTGPALYAGGDFSSVGGVPAAHVAKWRGSAWAPLGSGVSAGVLALAVYDDGTGPALFAGGRFTTAGGSPASLIAKWNGSTWSPLGVGTSGSGAVVDALCVFDPGTGPLLFVGGNFTAAGGYSSQSLAAWNGSTWITFGSGGGPWVYAIDVYDDGSGPALYIDGSFDSIIGITAKNIARWNGSTGSAVGAGLTAPAGYYSPYASTLRAFDEGSGARLFVAGNFAASGSAPVNKIARWDGSSWSALTSSTTITGPAYTFVRAYTFEKWDDGSGPALFVGGIFLAAGDHIANNVAKFDGAHWTALGNGLPGGSVFDLQPFDDGAGVQLYACGSFTNPSTGIGTRTVARWNGSTWRSLPGADFNSSVNALAVLDTGAGPVLYAGGTFWQVGTHTARGIARWNGSSWSEVGGGLANSLYSTAVGVCALSVWNDGSGPALFVGGQFDTAGSVHSGYIAKWNGSTWASLANGLDGPNPSTMVRSLAAWDDGTGPALFAAGNFLGASNGAVPAVYLGKWNGSAWSTVGNGTDNEVDALGVVDDGTGHGPELYAGGRFTDASGVFAQHIARWDGMSWSALSTGLTSGVFIDALAEFKGDLYVGGMFDQAGGYRSPSFARWIGCGQTGKLFCFGDGSGTACPCGNASNVGDRVGCLNSLNIGSALRASGEPSLAHDTLVLAGAQTTNGSASYFQGTIKQNGGAGTPFGDGLRCAGGSVRRLATKTPAGGLSQYPIASDLSVSVRGAVLAPGTRTYQVRYRNSASFCTSATFNLTNGVESVWQL